MRAFELIALTPPGICDPTIAISAAKAGFCGILDLEYVPYELMAFEAVQCLPQSATGFCGVKICGWSDIGRRLIAKLPACVRVVLLTQAERSVAQSLVTLLRDKGIEVLWECTSLDEAKVGCELGVQALVAKGHESGGRVGEETTFVLLQHLLAKCSLPVFAQGGIGLHTIAAARVAGACGVVLDAQLWLTRESALPADARNQISRMDGSETACLRVTSDFSYRVYSRPGLAAVEELNHFKQELQKSTLCDADKQRAWHTAMSKKIGWRSYGQNAWPLGQDAAFAHSLAKRFCTVSGLLHGLDVAITERLDVAQRLKPLAENSALARSHKTRYPIVQGPMTRVSDTPEFALQVAEAGGLPFLALALMKAPEVRSLLQNTRKKLGAHSWGVGILGFVPVALRQEQLTVLREECPPFALIAGGRPDQARVLENDGIPTYLHVPSPGLLRMFVQSGARRFVFEGRECGGHVGPRSSLVLWESMIEVLLDNLSADDMPACHVLFAGGIHDALSSSMVATISAELARRGAKIGTLLGTAYLFTREAVQAGAIVPAFQKEVLGCERTVLLETGPGHAIRCIPTPYVDFFERQKRLFREQGKSAEEIRDALEDCNVGRLRIASKGVKRSGEASRRQFLKVSRNQQRQTGMYMVGQVASLRETECSLADLHRDVSVAGTERLMQTPCTAAAGAGTGARLSTPADVAIVGMGCLLPKAPDLRTYWANILNKVDAITEIPPDRWNWRTYYDEDINAKDKICSRWGGFLDEIPFDPLSFGIPPNTLSSVEPLQLLTLQVVRSALADAGYIDREFPRERSSVILGAGGGVADLGNQYAVRSALPTLDRHGVVSLSSLPEWTEDSFPGILVNVAAGRVANRFNLGGVNYTVDAACASSLAAVYLAVRELQAGTSDLVIAGGVDTVQNPFAYLCFSKTHALSRTGRCHTFDESADGIAISEGVAILVLKRRSDAERDRDKIYGVIKGIAGSSDGRDRSLTAPQPEGQKRALTRAYAQGGISPATVSLVEAHGTGTVAGDQAEVEALEAVFQPAGAGRQSCALGSVKSMIGHTKCAAGVAGLIKVALALHHQVLPPTLGVQKPKVGFHNSPFYINSEVRPWFHNLERPRRAAVSAFGFGGTNFHAVLEEHVTSDGQRPAASDDWKTELFAWSCGSRQQLAADLRLLQQELNTARPKLSDLSLSVWEQVKSATETNAAVRLAIVAASLEDLRMKLQVATTQLQASGNETFTDPRGIYFAEGRKIKSNELAFLFPGQGSQYPGMLAELAVHFGEVRETFEMADRVLSSAISNGLSRYIFPPPSFTPEEQTQHDEALKQTNITQPALGAADLAMFRLLGSFGVCPNFVAGHSYGEYVALCTAGAFPEDVLLRISELRGRIILGAAGRGSMASVSADRSTVETLLRGTSNIWIANINSPCQTIVAGSTDALQSFAKRAGDTGLGVQPVAVSCAFHSPMMAAARDSLLEALSAINFCEPRVQAFSNTLANRYPPDSSRVAQLLADHLVQPVDFAGEIEAMYAAGARVFIEAGPRNFLTKLADETLRGRPHLSIATDLMGRSGLLQLQHALGQLFAHGSGLKLDRLFLGRTLQRFDLSRLAEQTRPAAFTPTTWLVNGGRARPAVDAQSDAPTVMADREEHLPLTDQNSSADAAQKDISLLGKGDEPNRRDSAIDLSRIPQAVASSQPETKATENTFGVMLRFNGLMQRFLDTQQQIMLAYLQGRSHGNTAAVSLAGISDSKEHTLRPQESISQLPTAVGMSNRATPEASFLPRDQSNDQPGLRVVDRSDPFSAKTIGAELLNIVGQRTGYPNEMLSLDRDMESDLGIDSIKRTEILAAFQRDCWPAERVKPDGLMDSLSKIKTLGGIIDRIVSELREIPTTDPTVRSTTNVPDVPRFVIESVTRTADRRNGRIPSSVVIVVDDDRRFSPAVLSGLKARKISAVLFTNHLNGQSPEKSYHGDFRDPGSVEAVVRDIRREQGPISGIIHLPALKLRRGEEISSLAEWRESLAAEAGSLFYLTKAAGPDLRAAAEAGCGWLAAGVVQGAEIDSIQGRFVPSDGAIRGFIKSVAAEWPGVLCKVIALDPALPAPALAAEFLDELVAGDDDIEVGFSSSGRSVLRAIPAPLLAEPSTLTIDAESVVLVTGGARGITAEAAHQLAKYRPTLLLLGRAGFPEAEESGETSQYQSPAELRSWLLRNANHGDVPTPVQIDAACRQILQEREMRHSIARMRRTGATVRYFQADARDEQALRKVVEQIYCDYGRLDGVIHGAGIIEDKLIEDKSYESFEQVFSTKVDSAFLLSRAVDPNSLKFFAFFSSISGTFGNRGQSDYAAANAALDQFAEYLDKKWPCRVVSFAWGPWDKVGMVSENVRKEFERRGVQIISPREGGHAFERELLCGRKGEVRVVLGGGPWQISDVIARRPREVYRVPGPQEQAVMSAD